MTQMEVIEGTVEAVNERGVRLAGNWYNVSKFRSIELPKAGAWVQLGVDNKGFILEVTALSSPTVLSVDRDLRLAALEAAARFAASRPEMKSADVLVLADRWLKWIEEGGQ